jgi:predicted AlkP superfamily pyrophosphatase or phosphodiesterase
MRFALTLACLCASFCSPVHAANQVIVLGFDGLGAAGLRNHQTPRFTELMRRGAWTMKARGVIPTVSSPNWASMINGGGPEQHGITSNEWKPEKHEIEPVCHGSTAIYPTMFDVLRTQQRSSMIGIFHHWADFARLVERGAANRIENLKTEEATMDAAIAWWKQQKPTLLFIHLDHVDHAGHDHGWTSPEYAAAIDKADSLLGRLMDAIRGTATTLIVTADHGGMGKKHGGLTMEELEIPWIAFGQGVRPGIELKTNVNTYDTAATVAQLLRLKAPACWVGKPVSEAFTK